MPGPKTLVLGQCFSTFWGSRHPLGQKKFGRTLTCSKMTFRGTLSNKTLIKRQLIQYLAAPFTRPRGNLVCRGTPVRNNCSRALRPN